MTAMKVVCELLVLLFLILGFVGALRRAKYGQKAALPEGKDGVIQVVLVTLFVLLVHCVAGTFSALLGKG